MERTATRRTSLRDLPREVFEEYRRTRSRKLRDRILTHYYPVVRRIARGLAASLPRKVDVEDLVGEGVFGLVHAIERYDPKRKTGFRSYCTLRVRGAMIDSLRADDWVPRAARRKRADLERASRGLRSRLGRAPTETELAREVEIPRAELRRLLRTHPATMVSLQETWHEGAGRAIQACEMVEDAGVTEPWRHADRREQLARAAASLEPRDRLIVLLYYFEHFTMKEIGRTLGISEPRVCQLHSRIIRRLRAQLSGDEAA